MKCPKCKKVSDTIYNKKDGEIIGCVYCLLAAAVSSMPTRKEIEKMNKDIERNSNVRIVPTERCCPAGFSLSSSPKRKVKKTKVLWINIYPNSALCYEHISKEVADGNASDERLGEAHKIVHEYEVEEE